MSHFNGTVDYSDVEGGCWLLKTENGETFQLDSNDNTMLKRGLKVQIQGKVEEDMMSFSMMGPVLSVKKWEKM